MNALVQVERPATVALDTLNRDPELACRAAGVSKATAAEYAEAMKAGAVFPPVVVFVDSKGVHWLADGFHRCAAAEQAGLAEVAADVREGSKKDALLHAASANAQHGLRRTNADKRRAVALVLAACPKWSDRKVGEVCGVSHPFVANVRKAQVVTVTTPEGEPAEPTGGRATPEPEAPSAVAQRLSAELQALLLQWPAEHQRDLEALLRAALGAFAEGPSQPGIIEP